MAMRVLMHFRFHVSLLYHGSLLQPLIAYPVRRHHAMYWNIQIQDSHGWQVQCTPSEVRGSVT